MATLEGKTIVVVGGSSGIGYGVAKASLLSLASRVIIGSSSSAKVESALTRLQADLQGKNVPGSLSGEVISATDPASVRAFITKAGEIDHLVWTSGGRPPIATLTSEMLDANRDVFDVMFWGAAVAARAANIRPGGSITFTIGAVVVRPVTGWTLGAALTGAVDSFTRALAVDIAPIRVNVVSPGLVKTELWDPLTPDARENMLKNAEETLLVKHVADADEIAEAYLFVMKCGYITGQRVEVDGGHRFT